MTYPYPHENKIFKEFQSLVSKTKTKDKKSIFNIKNSEGGAFYLDCAIRALQLLNLYKSESIKNSKLI